MKKFIVLGLLITSVVTFGNLSQKENHISKTEEKDIKQVEEMEIKLTKSELDTIGENKDAIAQMLVKKAILIEMEKKEYTEKEKKYLDEIKINLEIEFYLNSTARKTVQIYDYELLEVYKNNTELLNDKNRVTVYQQLHQVLFNKKLGEEKVKVLNKLIEKYKINNILKEYVKIEEVTDSK